MAVDEAPAVTAPIRDVGEAPKATVTNLRILLWSGPVGVVMVFFGLFVMAGFFPPPNPKLTGDEMAAIWQDNPELKKGGMILCFAGGVLYVTFTLVIGYLLRKCVDDWVMPATQTAMGIFGTVYFSLNFLILCVTAYRPDDYSSDQMQVFHDFGFILTFSPAAPFFLQYFAIAAAVLQNTDSKPLIPRWVGYVNIWVGVGLIPASFIPFFTSGPLAWNGIAGFYIPVVVFGCWYATMFWSLRRVLPRVSAPTVA